MIPARCDEGMNKGVGGGNEEKSSWWAQVKGKGGFRTSENKKVKKSFSVERSPECVLGYEEGARERKRLNQSMKEERDQSKIKKFAFSGHLLYVRPRQDVVNKYQLSKSKMCIFFTFIAPSLHT